MASLLTETLDGLVQRVETELPGRVLDQLTTAVEVSGELGRLGDTLIDHFVELARREGHSWAEIGTSLGVSRQAAQQRGGRFQQAPMGADMLREKGSPFAVWHLTDSNDIEVQVEAGNAWQQLVSLDGHDVSELIKAAKQADPRRWFKRLSEDLDEVYKELGAELGATAVAVMSDAAGRHAERTVDVTIAKRKHAWRQNAEAAKR